MIKNSINGLNTEILIDSGSVTNITDGKFFKQVKKPNNKASPTKINLIAAGSTPPHLEFICETSMTIFVENQPFDSSIKIVKNMIKPVIFGVEFLKQYNGIIDYQ